MIGFAECVTENDRWGIGICVCRLQVAVATMAATGEKQENYCGDPVLTVGATFKANQRFIPSENSNVECRSDHGYVR